METLNPMDIDRYITMAEENFSGADGFWDGQESGFIPTSEIDLNSNGFEYASGQTNMVAAKSPTPYMVNCVNTTPNPLTVVLFGMNIYLLTPNFGSAAGVVVTPSQTNVSYLQLLQQSASQPFDTSLIRVFGSSTQQTLQNLTLTSKDANGQECSVPIITQSYFSATQFQNTIVDVPYSVKLDGNTYITFELLGNSSATVTLFPSTKINPARGLVDSSPRQAYGAPAVPMAFPTFTGIPVRPKRYMVEAQNK